MTREQTLLALCLLLLAAALATLLGMLRFRRQYFRLYREVQLCQRALLADQPLPEGSCQEGAPSAVREDFARIMKKFRRERQEAREDRDAVRELTSNLSHQLKTPLANIRLYQELLKSPELPPGRRQCLENRLEEQTDRLDRLLTALFKMMDLERGAAAPSPANIPVLSAVRRAVESVLPRADQKHIRIRMEPFPDAPLLHDPAWTEEVFANILENAVKYAPEGSDVTLSMECFETYGAVRVQDKGPGIPKEEYTKIFQKFYRGSSSSGKEGWGIGLYLARLLVEREHGYITVSSEPGKGSTFSVFLPLMTEV